MNILRKLTIKQLMMNKRRSLVTIIAIILTSTLLFSIGIAASTARQIGINDALAVTGDYHVIFYNIPYSQYNILKNDKAINSIMPIQLEESIYIEEVNADYYSDLTIRILKNGNSLNNYLKLSDGKFPNDSNEIIVPMSILKDLDYKIGDYLNNYKIVGTYNESNLSSRNYNNFYTSSNYVNAYVKSEIKEDELVDFIVLYKSINNIYDKIYNTADNLNLSHDTYYDIKQYENTNINTYLLSVSGQYQSQDTKDGVEMTLTIILTILALFCIIIIYNSFSISLSERKRYIGTLRSIGTSKRQIFISVLYETLIISTIAIPIGLLLSFGVINFVLFVINKLLSSIIINPYSLAIYPSFIIISLIFIIITIFISSLFPAIKATNFSPISSIRMYYDIEIDDSKENNKIIRKIFGPEGEYAYKNIKRNASKYLVTTFSLGISIVLFIVISTYIKLAITYSFYDNGPRYDIYISIPKSDNQEKIINEILNIDYIDSVVKSKSMYLYYNTTNKDIFNEQYLKNVPNKSFDMITVFGLDQDSYNGYLKKIKLNDNTKMILYNKIAVYPDIIFADSLTSNSEEIYSIFKNENIEIDICDVNPANFVSSVIDEEDCYLKLENFYITDTEFDCKNCGPIIIVDMEKYDEISNIFNKYNKYDSYKTISLGINSKKFKQFDMQIKDTLDNYSYEELNYYSYALNNYNNHMSQLTTKFILYSIIVFITVIVVTTVYNIISTNMRLREVEFSILRSIGLDNKGMNKIIILESLFISFETLIYAIPFSLIIVYYISYAFKMVLNAKNIATLFPTEFIIISIISTVIINLSVMLISSKKIKEKNIIDSIRNQNI